MPARTLKYDSEEPRWIMILNLAAILSKKRGTNVPAIVAVTEAVKRMYDEEAKS